MAANSKQKEVTLAEFRAWLEGVEELQERGWSPDPKQWKLIRNKIKNIIDIAPAENAVVTAPVPRARVAPGPAVSSSALGIPPAPEVGSGGFPADVQPTEPSAEAQALLTGDKRKTPDLDTTDGHYESSFT